MAEWFYMSGGQQHGPVSAAQLKSLAASGGLVPEDLVWNQSMPEWVPARRVRGLPFAGQTPSAPTPAARPTARAAATRAPVRAAPPAEAEPPAQPFLSESSAAPAEYAAQPPPDNHSAAHAPARVDHAPAARATTHVASKPVPAGAPVHAVEFFAKTRTPLRLISFLTFLLMLASLAAGGFAGLVQFDKARKVLKDSVLSQIDDAVMPSKVAVDKSHAGTAVVAQAHSYRIPTDLEFMSVAGFYAFVAFILMIKLMRFSSKIGKLRATFGAEELERAVKSQTSLWRFLAMIVLITIAAGAVAYVRYAREIRWW